MYSSSHARRMSAPGTKRTCRGGLTTSAAEGRRTFRAVGLAIDEGRSRAGMSLSCSYRGKNGRSADIAKATQMTLSRHLASYSITSSAATIRVCGMMRPSTFAVLRLITNSNLVGCSTGKSAGLVPFKILSTNIAACFHISIWFGP
jgi:hypothetical protein